MEEKKNITRKGDLTKTYEEGGLKAIEFDTLNTTIKLNWLKSVPYK